MTKNTVRLLIALMTVALFGVLTLQMRFIYQAYHVKADQFNTHLFAVLNKVTERIDNDENYQVLNGYSVTFKDDKYLAAKQLRFDAPIEERIDLTHLDAFIQEAMRNYDITLSYAYGVYSHRKKGFVIFKDTHGEPHYLVTDTDTVSGSHFLKTSPYKANLFQADLAPPGYLTIWFPNESSAIWGNLWQGLVLSLMFAGIILGSFIYTMRIVFRQKKLGDMKNDFINNMTHELKTPIATINMATDIISNPNMQPDKMKRFINIIRQENDRMNANVSNILQMTLIDREEFKLKLTAINLHDVILTAADYIQLQVDKKEGIVETHLNAKQPIIEGDASHVANIINNLLDNANKYSPEKPEITISTRNLSHGVEVTVADKGIGISKEARKYVFDKFYRVPTGNLHDVKGFGLGLAYVKTMMTAHKGQVEVKSDAGKGSQFILIFPFRISQERDEFSEEEG
jgi:two-component system, OmpR family, phosphate regulon sensor histidine kinase PhoR